MTSKSKLETIDQLNKKAWYRAVKVFYLLVIVVLVVFGGLVVFSEGPDLDSKKTMVTCNTWIEYEGSLFEIDSEMHWDYRTNDASYKASEKIKEHCGVTNLVQSEADYKFLQEIKASGETDASEAFRRLRKVKVHRLRIDDNNTFLIDWSDEELLADYLIHKKHVQFFPLNPYDIVYSYTQFNNIKHLLIFIIVLTLLTEVARRSLYYIVLGKIFPKK